MHQALGRVAASRLVWAAAVLLLLYTLGGFMLAPYLIERYLPRYAEQHLEQRATVSAVRINPFLLTVEASGFRLEAAAAAQAGGARTVRCQARWGAVEERACASRACTHGRHEAGTGRGPGPIAYGDADTQKALEKLLTERAGSDAMRSFAGQYAKRTGRQPEQVNPLLGLLGRGSADHAYYEAMFAQLVELQPRLDSGPQLLAAERAQAIIDALRKAGIDRSRLQSGGITQVTGGSSAAIASEFALEVMPDAS